MRKDYSHKDLIWIDLESPTREEIVSLMETYDIHPLIAEELLMTTLRPKVDTYPNCIYLVLHFPVIAHKPDQIAQYEIDFVVGKNFIITVHQDMPEGLHEFSKMFEVNSLLSRIDVQVHVGLIAYFMLRKLYEHTLLRLDLINESIKKVERRVFEGDDARMVHAISDINRKLIDVRQAIRYHEDVLQSFQKSAISFFGEKFEPYMAVILGDHSRILSSLSGHREIIKDLRETNDTLIAAKTNYVVRTLTILAFTTLPITLTAGLLGIDTSRLPFLQNNFSFWIVLGIMAGIGAIMYIFFRNKRWF